MRKFLTAVCALLLAVFMPFTYAFATNSNIDLANYDVEDLSDVLDAEGIGYDLKNYTNVDSGKTIIYVFRLEGCGNCKAFYQFVASELLPTYSDKFVVKSFLLDRGNNPTPSTNANYALAERLMDFYQVPADKRANTTPFIFAGKSFVSFGALTADLKTQLVDVIQAGDTYDPIAAINNGDTTVDSGVSTPDPSDSMTSIFTDNAFTIYAEPALDSTYDFRVVNLDRKGVNLDRYDYVSAYDFAFYKNGQVVLMQNGKFTIYIPVSESYKYYRVAYLKDGKVDEVFDATYENGFVSFTTSHLSEYAIYGTNNFVTETNPNTLDQSQIYLAIFGVSVLMIVGGVVAYRKFVKN